MKTKQVIIHLPEDTLQIFDLPRKDCLKKLLFGGTIAFRSDSTLDLTEETARDVLKQLQKEIKGAKK